MLAKKSLEQLVNDYISYAKAHRENTESGNYRETNRAYKSLQKINKRIRDKGDVGERALIELLNHPDDGVKLWAAVHVLDFQPTSALAIITKIHDDDANRLRLNAKYILKQWRERGHIVL